MDAIARLGEHLRVYIREIRRIPLYNAVGEQMLRRVRHRYVDADFDQAVFLDIGPDFFEVFVRPDHANGDAKPLETPHPAVP
jgi:hypothetical protein